MVPTHGSVLDPSVARFAMCGTSAVATDVRKPEFAAGGATGRISRHVTCSLEQNHRGEKNRNASAGLMGPIRAPGATFWSRNSHEIDFLNKSRPAGQEINK